MSRFLRSLLWVAVYMAAILVLALWAWWPSLNRGTRAASEAVSTTDVAQALVTATRPPASATFKAAIAEVEVQPSSTKFAGKSTLTAVYATATATVTPSPPLSKTPTATPTATCTARPTMTPTEPFDLFDVGATPPPHLWLERPVSGEAHNLPDRFYPYGATGQDLYAVHHGVEFINPTGTQVRAAGAGTIEVAANDSAAGNYSYREDFYGQVVVLRLEQTYQGKPIFALYGHLSDIYVKEGQHVTAGEPLGEIGMTGVALGPHLHFEVRVGQNSYWAVRNPELWLKPLPERGLIIGRVVTTEGELLPEALVAITHADTPEQPWHQAWTYTQRDISIDGRRRIDRINPDDEWVENWVLGDVPAGDYLVGVRVNDGLYTKRVHVSPGEPSYVVLVVEQ